VRCQRRQAGPRNDANRDLAVAGFRRIRTSAMFASCALLKPLFAHWPFTICRRRASSDHDGLRPFAGDGGNIAVSER